MQAEIKKQQTQLVTQEQKIVDTIKKQYIKQKQKLKELNTKVDIRKNDVAEKLIVQVKQFEDMSSTFEYNVEQIQKLMKLHVKDALKQEKDKDEKLKYLQKQLQNSAQYHCYQTTTHSFYLSALSMTLHHAKGNRMRKTASSGAGNLKFDIDPRLETMGIKIKNQTGKKYQKEGGNINNNSNGLNQGTNRQLPPTVATNSPVNTQPNLPSNSAVNPQITIPSAVFQNRNQQSVQNINDKIEATPAQVKIRHVHYVAFPSKRMHLIDLQTRKIIQAEYKDELDPRSGAVKQKVVENVLQNGTAAVDCDPNYALHYYVGGGNYQNAERSRLISYYDCKEYKDNKRPKLVVFPTIMKEGRCGCMCTPLSDGKLLIVGGFGVGLRGKSTLRSCQLFDANKNTIESVQSTFFGTALGSLVTFNRTKVYKMGGCADGSPLHMIEVFNYSPNMQDRSGWSLIDLYKSHGPSVQAEASQLLRYGQAAIQINSREIMVFGGVSSISYIVPVNGVYKPEQKDLKLLSYSQITQLDHSSQCHLFQPTQTHLRPFYANKKPLVVQSAFLGVAPVIWNKSVWILRTTRDQKELHLVEFNGKEWAEEIVDQVF